MQSFIRIWKRVRRRLPAFRAALALLSVLGLAFLIYVLGAATMHFRLPCSDFLQKSFVGFQAYMDRGKGPLRSKSLPPLGVDVDNADKTFDGFTLVTSIGGAKAQLIDMRGNVVHEWNRPFSQVWPQPQHVRSPVADDQVHWFRCHLYPNGDLLAIYQTDVDSPHGYGLVKLDKDSNVLWAYAGNAHHDLDVAEDGNIYTLTHQGAIERPPGLSFLASPYIADYLVVLSPEGKELEKISLIEAFRDSAYALTLSLVDQPDDAPNLASPAADPPGPPAPRRPRMRRTATGGLRENGDVLHANSVKVLGRDLAPRFRLFRPGQVLISLRTLDAIAVLDVQTRSIVWSAQGIWRGQHDPEFIDNGHLLVYDNFGSSRGSRVLEYDPISQAVVWSYAGEGSAAFHAMHRGMKQRLPNGNTLIVDPDMNRLLEVTSGKELVWQYAPGSLIDVQAASEASSPHAAITGAKRYPADRLTFLKGGQSARP